MSLDDWDMTAMTLWSCDGFVYSTGNMILWNCFAISMHLTQFLWTKNQSCFKRKGDRIMSCTLWFKQSHSDIGNWFMKILVLRYDLIDRPGVLGNYVPLNYHCLCRRCLMPILVSMGCILRAGSCPPLNINAIWSLSIKSYLKGKEAD